MDKRDPQTSPVRPLLIAGDPRGKGLKTHVHLPDLLSPSQVWVQIHDPKEGSCIVRASQMRRIYHA